MDSQRQSPGSEGGNASGSFVQERWTVKEKVLARFRINVTQTARRCDDAILAEERLIQRVGANTQSGLEGGKPSAVGEVRGAWARMVLDLHESVASTAVEEPGARRAVGTPRLGDTGISCPKAPVFADLGKATKSSKQKRRSAGRCNSGLEHSQRGVAGARVAKVARKPKQGKLMKGAEIVNARVEEQAQLMYGSWKTEILADG